MPTLEPTANETPRDRLIADHIDVARRISLRVARRCPNAAREDLIAAGMLGLTEAANRYDAARGEPFVAFAEKRIRGAVLDELRRGDIMPRRIRKQARKVASVVATLEQALGRTPEDEEIAEALGVSVDDYRDDLEMLVHVKTCALETEDGRQHQAPASSSPLVRAQHDEILGHIQDALNVLSERNLQILSLHYNDQFTYAEIGNVLGVTASRVCQLHSRAIARLRDGMEQRRPA